MGVKEWYKNTLEDDTARFEKKYAVLLAVSLTGILAAMEKNEKIYKLAFIVMDSLLIIDTLVEMMIGLNKYERKRGK